MIVMKLNTYYKLLRGEMVNTLLPVFAANLFKWFIWPRILEVLVNLIFVVSISILRHPIDTKAHQLVLMFGVLYGMVVGFPHSSPN